MHVSRVALYLLGPPRLERGGKSLHISRRKVVALLAYLAMETGSHSRDALATLLWPEQDQSTARAYLRRALSELNRALGEDVLVIDRESAGIVATDAPGRHPPGRFGHMPREVAVPSEDAAVELAVDALA